MIQTFIEEHSTRMKGLFRGLDIPSSFSFGFHVALNFHASLRRRLYCLLHLDVCHIVDTCTKARYIVLLPLFFASFSFCSFHVCCTTMFTIIQLLDSCNSLSRANCWNKACSSHYIIHTLYTHCLKVKVELLLAKWDFRGYFQRL